jgi:hypothetical protein
MRAARLFEVIQRLRRLRVVTVHSLPDIAICACHRKVRVGRGDSSIPWYSRGRSARTFAARWRASLRSQNRR